MENVVMNVLMATLWLSLFCAFAGTLPERRLHRRRTGLFFILGMGAVFVAGILGWLLLLIPGMRAFLIWAFWRPFLYDMLWVGPVEELAKALVLMVALARMKPWEAPVLPVLMALALGTGFGFAENLLVYGGVSRQVMAERAFWMVMHGAYCAMAAAMFSAYLYPSLARKDSVPVWLYPVGLVAAAASHGLFNALLDLDGKGDLARAWDQMVGLGTLGLVVWMTMQNPFRAWSVERRVRALELLEESLRADPRQARTRVRMALYLLAGRTSHEADEALAVLRGLPDAHRKDNGLRCLMYLAAWNSNEGAAKEDLYHRFLVHLARTPRYNRLLPVNSEVGMGLREWMEAGRVIPEAYRRKEEVAEVKGWLAQRTLHYYLDRVLRVSGLPVKRSHLVLPVFNQDRP